MRRPRSQTVGSGWNITFECVCRAGETAKKEYSIWNKEMETMPREELQKLQVKRFKQTVKRVYDRLPFYKKLFDDGG